MVQQVSSKMKWGFDGSSIYFVVKERARTTTTYYEADKMPKHPYIQINGQEYEQATLSGLLPATFR